MLLALQKFKVSEDQKFSIDLPEPLLAFALSCGMHSSPAVSTYGFFLGVAKASLAPELAVQGDWKWPSSVPFDFGSVLVLVEFNIDIFSIFLFLLKNENLG